MYFYFYFSETLVEKMSKETRTPLGGMFGNALWASYKHKWSNGRGYLEISNFNEEFGVHDIVD